MTETRHKRGSNPVAVLGDRLALLSHELNNTTTNYPAVGDETLHDAYTRGAIGVLESMVTAHTTAAMPAAWRSAIADECDRIRAYIATRRAAGFNRQHGPVTPTTQALTLEGVS